MHISLRWLLLSIGSVALLLAVARWQPMLGIFLTFCFLPPMLVASLGCRLRAVILASLLPIVVILYFWVQSYRYSVSLHWKPGSTGYEAATQTGHIYFLKIHSDYPGQVPVTLDGYPNPSTEHWSRWPGIYAEEYLLQMPGIEAARTRYIVPITSPVSVDKVEVLALSYWVVLVMLISGPILVLLFVRVQERFRLASRLGTRQRRQDGDECIKAKE